MRIWLPTPVLNDVGGHLYVTDDIEIIESDPLDWTPNVQRFLEDPLYHGAVYLVMHMMIEGGRQVSSN